MADQPQVTNVECYFCQRTFSIRHLFSGNPYGSHASPPVPVSLRPRCDDASVLLFKQKTKNICALGFDEFLALTDIDDNDDAQTRPSTRSRKHLKMNSRALFLTPWLFHVQASAAGYKLRHVLFGCIIIYALFRKCPKPRYIPTIPRSLTVGFIQISDRTL